MTHLSEGDNFKKPNLLPSTTHVIVTQIQFPLSRTHNLPSVGRGGPRPAGSLHLHGLSKGCTWLGHLG